MCRAARGHARRRHGVVRRRLPPLLWGLLRPTELTSSVLFAAPSRIEVYGSEDYAIGTGTLGPHGAGDIVTSVGALEFPVDNPFVGEIDDFAHAIRDGRPPEVDGAEGLRNVELLEAVGG